MNRRGRPVEVDRDRVALVALRLFGERGFDAVTMEDIAQAADVSRRTLFRLFSTKSTLVWDGLSEGIDTFTRALADAPGGVDAMTAVREACVRALASPSQATPVMRARLRLIAAHPDLYAEVIPRFSQSARQLVRFLADRLELDADGLFATVAANAVTATAFAALTWWAQHGDGAPQATLDRALRQLEQGLGTVVGRSAH